MVIVLEELIPCFPEDNFLRALVCRAAFIIRVFNLRVCNIVSKAKNLEYLKKIRSYPSTYGLPDVPR